MGVVTLRTGLTPDLLRAWEKRYGAVTPSRSSAGQRVYTDADIERLALLARAVKGGRAIGQIASLPVRELQRIVEEDAKALGARTPSSTASPAESRASLQAAALAAIERFDAAELESTLRSTALRLGIDEALDGVIAPLLLDIGARWHAGRLGPAHEHLATAVIRRTLHWMMDTGAPPSGERALVVATLAGQAHELGAMLAAAAASSHGWRVIYLGANLPARDISVAANQTRASAVALSFVHPAEDPTMADALRELRATLLSGIAILAGGSAAANYAPALAAVGAARFGSIRELRAWLRGANRTV
jgi:methylmalonyl-CoA mutase cobalamin-binding subunit/DNA-binding transcriptional MerR regulator